MPQVIFLVWIYAAGACPVLHGVYSDLNDAEEARHQVSGSIEIKKVARPADPYAQEVSEK